MKPAASRRRLLLGAAGLLAVGVGTTSITFSRDLRRSRQRLAGRSTVIPTTFGALEFADVGRGPPLLAIHGTGGGFDQGLTFCQRLTESGHRVIAPSRFGYLRSEWPEDPSTERQADAFVTLLDHLRIDRAIAIGASAGALPAAAFALRHAERCAGLVLLVPAANLQGRDPVVMSAWQKYLLDAALGSDFLFWAASRMAPGAMFRTVLATDPALIAQASSAEQARARTILAELLPVSAKRRGLLNDALRAGSPAGLDFASIQAPTLIVSCEDDRFGTAATARTLAATIRRAQVIIYPSGGHIWVGRDEEMSAAIKGFVAGLLPK